MALVLKDRVKQTAAAPGTGMITLSGSVTGFQSFASVGNGNTTYFAIVDPISGDWEVNYGVYTSSGTTLTRNSTPLSSSNSGSLVNFTGAVDVFVTYPSENAVWQDTSGTVVQQSFGAITATSAALTTGTVSTTPAANTDIANKLYVDGLVTQGISYHEPVYVESPNTAGNLNALYNQPGGAGNGVGATLTNNGTKAALTIDGILMTTTKRVLIYNQTNAFENGVYTVTTVGTPDPGGTNWVLTRATDADTYGLRDPNALGYNDAFFVTNGNTGAGETYVCTTSGVITFGSTNITFAQISSAQIYSAGTGLTLTNTTFSITPTGTAGTYGSASQVPVFVTNASGQVTSATNTNIAITGSQVSGNISGSAGSVANALTAGSYLTSAGTFDGSAARTFAVDATAVNTASKVVARDVSGNFSAGTITAALTGNASTATAATNISAGAANQIPYQTGAATTSFIVAPTTAATYLNWTGSAFAYSALSLPNALTINNGGAGGASGSTFNGSSALTISYNTVGAPSTGGTGATGTWGISISGNAATATSATSATTATNLAGGSAGTIPYQSAAGTTVQLAAGTSTYLLQSNGAAAPSWVAPVAAANNGTLTMAVSGTGLTGSATFTANQAGASSFTVTSNATNANTASTIVARDASGNFSAGTITAALSGNATTATSATSATTATNVAGGVAGAIHYQSAVGTTGFSAAGTSGQVLTSTGTTAPGWTTSTSANTASAIVQRDASGNFSAGTITAALSGNATTATSATSATSATTATTATNLAGGSAGTIPYQSAAGTTVQLTAGTAGYILQANGAAAPSWVVASTAAGVNNGTLTMNVSGTGLSGSQTFTANQAGAATFTVTSNATNANTASTIVARDASGNFSAGTITAALSGNATTATSATTATTASNASLLNNISAVNLYNNMGQPHSTTTSFDAQGVALTRDFGYRFVQGNTNSPGTNGATQYYAWNIGLGSEYPYNQYAAQFALPRDVTTPYLSVRYEEAGVLKAWQKIAAGFADSATSATSATTATTATNLAGGSAGTVPYQSAAGTTVQLAAGTAGQFLKSNGAAAPSWSAPSSIILENSKTIAANYTIGAGNNGLSVGPVTINSGVTVTVGSGQRWLVL